MALPGGIARGHALSFRAFWSFGRPHRELGTWRYARTGRTCTAVLAGSCRVRIKGRTVSAAHLVAFRPRECPKPCFRHALRRDAENGHLWAGPFLRLATCAAGGRLGSGLSRGDERRARCRLRARSARPQTAARLPQCREHRNHSHWAGLCPGRDGTGQRNLGTRGVGGRTFARVESRFVQVALVLRRRLGVTRDRHTRAEQARWTLAIDAVDHHIVRVGRGGDFRAAAAERLCQRMARLSRPVRRYHGSRAIGLGCHSGGDSAGRDRRVGPCVFRESLRSSISRHSAFASSGARARKWPGHARCDVATRGSMCGNWPRASRFLAGGPARGGCLESRVVRSENTSATRGAWQYSYRAGASGAMLINLDVASRAAQLLGPRADMGLRLCCADHAHAIYRRVVRRNHHGMVRMDSAPGAARAPAYGNAADGRELFPAHAGDRPRIRRRAGSRHGDATFDGHTTPATWPGAGLPPLSPDRTGGPGGRRVVRSGPMTI